MIMIEGEKSIRDSDEPEDDANDNAEKDKDN